MLKTTTKYPLAYVTYDDGEVEAVNEVLHSYQTTCGKKVAEFETLFANYVGRNNAIMVNSGSSADMLVAFSFGLAKPGEEILVPAVTWPTQVWACLLAGYKVRLVDVDPSTLQFDVPDMMRKCNERTRAIFPVHVLGNVGRMDILTTYAKALNIPVLEDCCEALGSRYQGKHVGTFGQSAAFSFFFSHLINTMEGGMVVTDELPKANRLLRSHGWAPRPDYRFWFPSWGFNVRPTEVQGAFGCVQMAKIDDFRLARVRNYDRLAQNTFRLYPDVLRGVVVSDMCEPAWHGFPLLVHDASFTRDQLCQYLDAHGIETRPIIAGNLARQPAVQNDPRVIGGMLPGADIVHNTGFYIGLASVDDVDGTTYVAEILNDFMKAL